MLISDPSLQIYITHRNCYWVEFRSSTGKTLKVPALTSPLNIRSMLYSELDKFWKIVGTQVASDYYAATRALLFLHGLGSRLNMTLFGSRYRYSVEKFVKAACPGWRKGGLDGYIPPVIKVTTQSVDEHWLPFEFLPFFDTTEPQPIGNKDEETLKKELPLLASRFLGFSTIVSRIYAPPDEEGSEAEIRADDQSKLIIENLPSLSVRFFHHAALEGAKREGDFFRSANWIELRGPWPNDALDPTSFVSELAVQLWDAYDRASNGAPQSVDQIQHFACHCDTTPTRDVQQDTSASYSLYLAHKKGWILPRSSERRATIGAINKKFGVYDQRDLTKKYPVVFLNACGSSKLTAMGADSFPKLFMGLEGNRGVIGTETSIPDLFAAAFAKRFYLNLIRDSNLGQAIYRARWGLLNKHQNPLGILYTIYGDPNLHVRRQMPEVTVPPVA